MEGILNQLIAVQAESEALIAVYDPDDCIVYANPTFRAAFFVDENEYVSWCDLMRRNYHAKRGSRIDTTDIEAWLTSTLSRRAKLPHRSYESHLTNGRCLWIVETTVASGWNLFIASDITELRTDDTGLRNARDTAVRAAQTDDLTGISNRRHIMSMLEALMAGQTSTRSNSGYVCILDIDHFKRLNDLYGHIVGDEALRGVAQTIRANIRLKDMFGRIGGEEFLLVLPDCSHREVESLINRLLKLVRECAPSESQPALRLTCSAGLTDIRPDDTINAIYDRADKSLYRAKENGRNCFMFDRSCPSG
jgi:diguanylate cyclase (GGDEF)-like protein